MAEEKKKKKRLYKNTYNPDCTSNKLHSEKYGFIEIENPEYYKKDNGC